MANRTLVIAECGSSWRFGDDHLGNAYRMIDAAKECGADVAKFQWTSNPVKMAERRGHPEWAANYEKYLAYPVEYLHKFKAKCDEVGIEFMVTVYLIEDIPVVEPLVKRMKISAYESGWVEFCAANRMTGKEVVVSSTKGILAHHHLYKWLHCVSQYPTALENLHVSRVSEMDGISDHSTSVLTGALAVAAGASVVEKHVKLHDTPDTNPDAPHSLIVDSYTTTHAGCCDSEEWSHKGDFHLYIKDTREAEKAMGYE